MDNATQRVASQSNAKPRSAQPRLASEVPHKTLKRQRSPLLDLDQKFPTQQEYRSSEPIDGVQFSHTGISDRFCIAIHGEPHSGKTSIAASAPKPFFLATESATVEQLSSLGLKIPYLWISSHTEMVKACKRLPMIMKRTGAKTIVVDTFSTLADLVYAEVLDRVRAYYAPDPEAVGVESYDPKLTFDVWGEVFRALNDIRRRLDVLGFSVVYVCHSKAGGGYGEDSQPLGPDVQGSFKTRMLRFPAATFYVERKSVKDPATGKKRDVVLIHTRGSEVAMARCKWKLDPIESPDLGRILEKAAKAAQGPTRKIRIGDET